MRLKKKEKENKDNLSGIYEELSPLERKNIENLDSTREMLKKTIDFSKLYESMREIIPLWSKYEEILWEDILINLFIIYSWRVPSNIASNINFLILLDNFIYSIVTFFYSNVLGIPLKIPQQQQNKETAFEQNIVDDNKKDSKDSKKGNKTKHKKEEIN